MSNYNILISGVGGQGSLLASRIVGAFFINRGLNVKVSEVHGMSQRGGSVITHVRAGESVASPLVSEGEADTVIAMEQLEGIRYVHWLKPGGNMVVSTQKILPMPVVTGAVAYPEGIFEKIRARGVNLREIPALELARQAGSIKAANVVLIGAASHMIGGSPLEWENALKSVLPEKLFALNLKAFNMGRDCMI